jgi:hypothetical protein
VAFNYGGGLRFGKPGSLRFNVFAEDLRFRVDRTLLVALPGGATPPNADPDANRLRSSLTYGAGLSIPIGGGAATYDDTPQYQLGNVALPIDVFAGRQNFAGASGCRGRTWWACGRVSTSARSSGCAASTGAA